MVESHVGQLVIHQRSGSLDAQTVAAAVSRRSLQTDFDLNPIAHELLARWSHASRVAPSEFAEPTTDFVRNVVESWLQQFWTERTGTVRWSGAVRWSDIDVAAAFRQRCDANGLTHRLDRLAPRSLALTTATNALVTYASDSGRPTVRVRLQDLFGTTTNPTVGDGREPVTIEMLSPANRVIAVTNDLARFWKVGYPAVRSDLRGRYPKHHWPEDPVTAEPRRINNPRPR